LSRSGFEKFIKKLFKDNDVKYRYEPYGISFILEKQYVPDFVLDNGIHIEAKGYLRPEDRRKLLSVKEQNPSLDLRIWFQKDGYLTKKKKVKYSEWAERNGFDYHIGDELPERWL